MFIPERLFILEEKYREGLPASGLSIHSKLERLTLLSEVKGCATWMPGGQSRVTRHVSLHARLVAFAVVLLSASPSWPWHLRVNPYQQSKFWMRRILRSNLCYCILWTFWNWIFLFHPLILTLWPSESCLITPSSQPTKLQRQNCNIRKHQVEWVMYVFCHLI